MKILITGGKYKWGLTNSFIRAFKELGCQIIDFDDEQAYKDKSSFLKNRYTNRLFWKLFSLPLQETFLNFARAEKPDLILILKGAFFCPKTFLTIKKELAKTKLFCFNPDNPFNTWHYGNSNSWIRKSIPLYDAYFIWGKFLIEPLKKAGAKKVEYLAFGYDSHLHYPIKVDEKEKKFYGSDVAFVGTWDKERQAWLEYIKDYDLKIWGNSWQRASKLKKHWQGKALYGEESSKVCSASKIILNIVRKQNIPSHNMRTFEVPACAGFMLATRTEEQKEFFEEGEEADNFSTPAELKEKINFYLKNNELRQKIAEAGHRKLLSANYSYTDRAKRILEIFDFVAARR